MFNGEIMKHELIVRLELNSSEAEGLKRILGNQSDIDYKEKYGLDNIQMTAMHDLYDILPDKEEKE